MNFSVSKKQLICLISLIIAMILLIFVRSFNPFIISTPEPEENIKNQIKSTPIPKPVDKSIDELVKDMTLEEKIGQLLMPALDGSDGLDKEMEQLITKYHIGGVILFQKDVQSPSQTLTLTNDLQKLSKEVPMFIAIDQEGGLITRIPFGTKMPGNMALGATQSTEYAYEVAHILGRELKSLGINVNFSPILDVNNNPNNPVIGVRSFGASPRLVSEMGLAYIDGLSDSGMIAAAKHFPGHGDTDVDSHLALPFLAHNMSRLEQLELIPFLAAIEEDVEMIMTAHIALPSIDSTKVKSKLDGEEIFIPSTLSHTMITEHLRNRLNYQGVIITDAMNMKAIADHFGEMNAVKMAIQAGVDMILMPPKPDQAFKAIQDQVLLGKISEKQIDASVRRILTVKKKYGLFQENHSMNLLTEKIAEAEKLVGSEVHKKREDHMADHAVTLVKNDQRILPIKLKEEETLFFLAPNQETLHSMLRILPKANENQEYSNVQEYDYEHNEKLSKKVKKEIGLADYIILGTYNLNLKKQAHRIFVTQAIQYTQSKQKKLVVIATGNPFDIQYFPSIPAYLAVYGNGNGLNVPSAMKVIFGKLNPTGKLPVWIPVQEGKKHLYDIGHGLSY
jgi:beta-N-acetylhexosaminidase